MRKFISSAIHVIVQVARMMDGSRRLVSVQEITGMEGNVITMQEIFTFKQTRVDSNGRVRGYFKFQGIRPKFMERFKIAASICRRTFLTRTPFSRCDEPGAA